MRKISYTSHIVNIIIKKNNYVCLRYDLWKLVILCVFSLHYFRKLCVFNSHYFITRGNVYWFVLKITIGTQKGSTVGACFEDDARPTYFDDGTNNMLMLPLILVKSTLTMFKIVIPTTLLKFILKCKFSYLKYFVMYLMFYLLKYSLCYFYI